MNADKYSQILSHHAKKHLFGDDFINNGDLKHTAKAVDSYPGHRQVLKQYGIILTGIGGESQPTSQKRALNVFQDKKKVLTLNSRNLHFKALVFSFSFLPRCGHI